MSAAHSKTPQLCRGGQGAELNFKAPSVLMFWTLLQICLALPHVGSVSIRMILGSCPLVKP